MKLSSKEILCLLWAIIDSEPELCYVPDTMPKAHVEKLRNLHRDDMSDEDLTRLYQKLAQEYVS